MSTIEQRPEIADEEHLEYLDGLREMGVTNMFGAESYLRRAFGLTSNEATNILLYWMRTFSERHPRS